MAKDTFYFSHDYNARADVKIKRLISKYGMGGYGIFWAIIEDLYNNNNELPTDYELLAFDLRSEVDVVRSIVNDFDLFVIQDGLFGSMSIQSRIGIRNDKSAKGKEAAAARWDKSASPKRYKAKECLFYLIRIYSQDESFLKVGITTESVARRYSGKLSGYEFELLFSHDDEVEKCLRIEREVWEQFSHYNPLNKFAGSQECLNINSLQSILDFAMQAFEIRNAIKESKGNKVKEIKEIAIPEISEFLAHAKILCDKAKINFPDYSFSIESKYEAWVADGWKDGHGEKIKVWKTKLANTLSHLKPIKQPETKSTWI